MIRVGSWICVSVHGESSCIIFSKVESLAVSSGVCLKLMTLIYSLKQEQNVKKKQQEIIEHHQTNVIKVLLLEKGLALYHLTK